jgi:hypothetical protein
MEMQKLANEQKYSKRFNAASTTTDRVPCRYGKFFSCRLAKNSNNDMISKYLTQINGNNNRNIFDTNRQEKVNKLADVAASASNLLPSEISMSMTGPTIK